MKQIAACVILAAAAALCPAGAEPSIVIDPAVRSEPFSGRVYVALVGGEGRPRQQMLDWFRPAMVFSKDVTDLKPGQALQVDDTWLSFPKGWADLDPGQYSAQAVVRCSPDSPEPGRGEGDLYSEVTTITVTGDGEPPAEPPALVTSRKVAERPFRETDRVKLFEMVSPALTRFNGEETKVRAGVVLPENFKDDGSRRYPIIYSVTGFGGDHRAAASMRQYVPPAAAEHVILVVPDPKCYRGHSVFADSANNGPWGEMLVNELAPAIEEKYHAAGIDQRYVTGVSSGGWSSLWLQVTYPDQFAGCWSHCPDPVDFRDFQRINLYEPGANMYRDEKGNRRPIARQGDEVILWYDDFCRREWALGPGGQIHSFEAVFSRRGPDGSPELLFDRETGAVDPEVARSWEPYDIRLVLERNWKELGPRLAGKLHVYAGEKDTFYLEGSSALLKESLEKLGSDAVVQIAPGMPHTLIPEGHKDMFETILSRAGVESQDAAAGAEAR